MPFNVEEVLKQLKTGISDLAQSSVKKYVAQATSDGQSMLTSMESDLKNWTSSLASGALTPDDFKDLVLGQKDLLKLSALTQAGIAVIEADKFKQAVLNLVISTITSAIK